MKTSTKLLKLLPPVADLSNAALPPPVVSAAATTTTTLVLGVSIVAILAILQGTATITVVRVTIITTTITITIAVAILVAISVEAVVILRGSARRGITMGVTVVEGLGMWQGTVRVGLEPVITAVGMDIWLGIAPAQEELVVEGLAVVIVVDVLIVVRKGTLLGIVPSSLE